MVPSCNNDGNNDSCDPLIETGRQQTTPYTHERTNERTHTHQQQQQLDAQRPNAAVEVNFDLRKSTLVYRAHGQEKHVGSRLKPTEAASTCLVYKSLVSSTADVNDDLASFVAIDVNLLVHQ